MPSRARSFSIPMRRCRQGSASSSANSANWEARGAVTRYLRKEDLPLPMRPLHGPAPHEVVWQEATNPWALSILYNPGYAGAYVYDRRRQTGGRIRQDVYLPRTTKVPIEDWEVCLQAAHPGYIGWEEQGLWLHAGGTNPGSTSGHSQKTRPSIPPSPNGDGVGYSDHDRFRVYLAVHWCSGLQPPCLRFATAVTGRHARLGTRLLARLCRGRHLRRLTSTRLQGATPVSSVRAALPHAPTTEVLSIARRSG